MVSGEYISQLGRNAAGLVHTIASRELAALTLGDAGGAVSIRPVSTTQMVALVEELRAGRPLVGDRVAMLVLASGIELGVVRFTVDEELAGPLRPTPADGALDRGG